MAYLDRMQAAAYDPLVYARGIRGEGRRVMGYFCSYAPEEIILAAGLHPLRLQGTREELRRCDEHLQAYCCSLARGALEDLLRGNLDGVLDGVVFPHTCDTMQRLSDIWRMHGSTPFHADVVLPVKLHTPAARDYLLEVLTRFCRELREAFGVDFDDDDLRDALRVCNAVRLGVEQVYRLRSERPGLLSGREWHALLRGASVMDRGELSRELPGLVDDLRGRETPDSAYPRVLISGSVCDFPEIYELVELSGARVVWDDLCSGTRAFDRLAAEDGDPLEALAERYVGRQLCPAKHLSPTRRADDLVQMIREHRVQGVIFLLLKFCDPHAFDYPWLKQRLEQEGVPTLLVEVEDRLPAQGQLRTRLETFVHML